MGRGELTFVICASRCMACTWDKKLHEHLVAMGFKESDADPSLYVRDVDGDVVHLLVYVNDLLIVSYGVAPAGSEVRHHAGFRLPRYGGGRPIPGSGHSVGSGVLHEHGVPVPDD